MHFDPGFHSLERALCWFKGVEGPDHWSHMIMIWLLIKDGKDGSFVRVKDQQSTSLAIYSNILWFRTHPQPGRFDMTYFTCLKNPTYAWSARLGHGAISLGYCHNGKSQFLVSSSVSFLHCILDIELVSSLTSRPYQFSIVFKNQCFLCKWLIL